MKSEMQDQHDYGFLAGLVTGTFVGMGLAVWLAPRLGSEVRERVTDTAREFSERASEGYQQVSQRVDEVVEDITKKGQRVRNDVADAVARGAHEVERRAAAAKTDASGSSGSHPGSKPQQ
jgi:gas vesicle protein